MAIVTGKFFRNKTNSVSCIPYDSAQNYYGFIQDQIKQGYQQCIITSDLMISIIEYYMLKGNLQVNTIEFMEEDEDLSEDIKQLLNALKGNVAYWEILKRKLEFLSEDSIDIKKVELRYCAGDGSLITIMVNGIITVSGDNVENLINQISAIIGKHIK